VIDLTTTWIRHVLTYLTSSSIIVIVVSSIRGSPKKKDARRLNKNSSVCSIG